MKYLEQLKSKLGNPNIVFVCQTGSTLFCENCHDLDYIAVLENWDKTFSHESIDGEEYYCYSLSEFEKFAKLETGTFKDLYALALLFNKTEYGTNPLLGYNWFKYQNKALETVLKCGKVNYFNKYLYLRNENGEKVCPKTMCWALATFYVIINQSATFTAEQKQVLQLCHDKQLPIKFAETLEKQVKEVRAY